MDYLAIFVLAIITYNFILPFLDSAFGFASYKFTLYRARDEVKIKEMELEFMKKTGGDGTQDSHVIGFNRDSFEEEYYDDEECKGE